LNNPFKWGGKSRCFTWIKTFALLSLSCFLSNCQLLVLPFYALSIVGNLATQIITQAFVLPFQLLPLAIKYAPLALLFLEAPAGDEETFYVEWFKPDMFPYRTESFVDKTGREIKVIIAPSQSLDLGEFQNLPATNSAQALVLTSAEFENASREELSETWEILKNRPDTIWVSGSPANTVRRETLSAYI